MSDHYQPRRRGSLPVQFLAVAVVCASALATVLSFLRRGVSVESLLNGAVILLVAGIVAMVLLLEDRRARSVILTEAGVSSLAWTTRPSFPFVWLSRVDFAWARIDEVGTSGFVVGFKSGRERLLVNTFLFPDPDRTRNFIAERLRAVGKDGNAL